LKGNRQVAFRILAESINVMIYKRNEDAELTSYE